MTTDHRNVFWLKRKTKSVTQEWISKDTHLCVEEVQLFYHNVMTILSSFGTVLTQNPQAKSELL